jgi:hypothetical protein
MLFTSKTVCIAPFKIVLSPQISQYARVNNIFSFRTVRRRENEDMSFFARNPLIFGRSHFETSCWNGASPAGPTIVGMEPPRPGQHDR